MIVKFATVCDRSYHRSLEYTAWPTCRVCHRDICSQCDRGLEVRRGDDGEPATTLCRDCDPEEDT